MKKHLSITVLLLSLMAVGCGRKPASTEVETIVLDYREEVPEFDMAAILEDRVEIVPLETSSESLVGEIRDVRLIGDELFVIEEDRRGRILVFDREGHYLRQIGRVGRGPGEYVELSAVEITDDYVVIFDNVQVNLLFYGLDGSFIASKDAEGLWANEIVYSDDKLYLVNKRSLTDIGGNYYLYEITSEGDYVQSLLEFDKEMYEKRIGWALDKYSSRNGDEFLVHFPPYDSLYVMKNGNLREILYVDFGSRKVPQSVIDLGGTETMIATIRGNYIPGAELVHLTDRYMIISFNDNQEHYTALYDRETKKTEIAQDFYDSRFPGLGYGGPIIRDNLLILTRGSWLFKLIVPDLPEYADPESPKSDFQKQMIELSATIGEDDNPVLFIQRFK